MICESGPSSRSQKAGDPGPPLRVSRQELFDTRLTPVLDKAFGRRLYWARRYMKLSQKELGRLLGIPQCKLSRIENGKAPCADFTYARFRAVLGKHVSYVLTGHGSRSYEPREITLTGRGGKKSQWLVLSDNISYVNNRNGK